MGQCMAIPEQEKVGSEPVKKQPILRAKTFSEKYGVESGSQKLKYHHTYTLNDRGVLQNGPEYPRPVTLSKSDFPSMRKPIEKRTINSCGESIACDSMRMSPDSTSTGPATSLGRTLSSDCGLPQTKILHITPLKPQVPFIEAESGSESDVLEGSGEGTTFELGNIESDPVPDSPTESTSGPYINIWNVKDGVRLKMQHLLDCKMDKLRQIAGNELSDRLLQTAYKIPLGPSPTVQISNGQRLGARAATMPIATYRQDYSSLIESRSLKSTAYKGDTIFDEHGISKKVEGEILEVAAPALLCGSDCLSPEGAGLTSPGTDTPCRVSQACLTVSEIDQSELIKVNHMQLGRGVSGTVYLSYWMGAEVAVKEWHGFICEEARSSMLQEAETLGRLRHPCVLPIYGYSFIASSPATITEYMVDGCLQKKLADMRYQGLSTDQKVAIALRIAFGMQFLHSKHIIHFDLKAANLLCDLRDATRPVVKIADVGLSKSKLNTFVSGNMRGTLPWMAPELFPSLDCVPTLPGSLVDRVDEKVDVYSFSIVLWEIWTLGQDPYEGLTTADVLYGLMSGTLRPEIPSDCESFWANLMRRCWDRNPVYRPTFSEITKVLDTDLHDRDLELV